MHDRSVLEVLKHTNARLECFFGFFTQKRYRFNSTPARSLIGRTLCGIQYVYITYTQRALHCMSVYECMRVFQLFRQTASYISLRNRKPMKKKINCEQTKPKRTTRHTNFVLKWHTKSAAAFVSRIFSEAVRPRGTTQPVYPIFYLLAIHLIMFAGDIQPHIHIWSYRFREWL